MRRWVAEHYKLLAIAAVGVVELAAFIIADPGELPDWMVTAAVIVQALAVYLAPRNARQVTRDDLLRKTDYYERPRPPRQDDVAGPPARHLKGDKRPGRGQDPPGTVP